MARHKNVRALNIHDECEDYDGYGESFNEYEYGVSPSVEQYMFDRNSENQISSFISTEKGIPEEDDECEEVPHRARFDSTCYKKPVLNEMDEARLQSCLDEMRSVVGETISEAEMTDAVIKADFNCEKALQAVLSLATSPQHRRSVTSIESDGGSGTGTTRKLKSIHIDEDTFQSKPDAKYIPFDKGKLEGGYKGSRDSSPCDKPRAGMSTPRKQLSRDPSPSKHEPLLSTPAYLKSSRDSSPANTPKSRQKASVNIEEEYARDRGEEKDNLNLVVVGHVDAGKSTLMGHLLYQVGAVNKKVMHKYEQESKKLGKQSFMYAWVLDETGEERSRGITMDIAQSKFSTDSKLVTLLDAPGHKDFIPNMITGAAQADTAVLVVDATKGEFETGFEDGGQTREHALLVRSLGVSQLCVAVNKMDNVAWCEDRFSSIQGKLRAFLMKHVGFKGDDLTFVPTSGLAGENLATPATEPQLISWYKGPSIIKVIDGMRCPERLVHKPLRLLVSDVFKGMGSGFCVSGKMESGMLSKGDNVLLMPQAETLQVKGISLDEIPSPRCYAGDQVVLTLSGCDMQTVSQGCVISSVHNPIRSTTKFHAKVVIFNIDVPITRGFPVVLHYQSVSEPATISKLLTHVSRSGEVIKRRPRCLTKNVSAEIVITTQRPVCVELYKDNKELGRFMLRCAGNTIAAGLVTQIL